MIKCKKKFCEKYSKNIEKRLNFSKEKKIVL